MKILMVLSSAGRIPGTQRATGTWLEEFSAPYYAFLAAGADITLASPAGGAAPLDPTSLLPQAQTPTTQRYQADLHARQLLATTQPLGEMRPSVFDAVYFCGGLGPVFDLSDSPVSCALIQSMDRAGKPIAAVCHGVAVLRKVRAEDGTPLVQGRRVTGFSNSEEHSVNEPGLVPWLVEDEMRSLGGHFSRAADWQPHVVSDRNLFTGQNPASAEELANQVLQHLSARADARGG